VPAALEACVMRALDKRPHQRPQGADLFAGELWSALMATVEGASLPLPPPRPPGPSPAVVVASVLLTIAGLGTALSMGAWLWWRTPSVEVVSDAPADGPAPPTTAPASTTTAPPPSASSAGLGPATPEKRLLVKRSTQWLEAELQRLMLLSDLPRLSIERSRAEYRHAIAHPPVGEDPNGYRKALLAELIVAWRAARSDSPRVDDRSTSELEAVFLTMDSAFDLQTRRQMLHELRKPVPGRDDADAAVKATLLTWIDTFAAGVDAELQLLEQEPRD
jgi:hypothetical protein